MGMDGRAPAVLLMLSLVALLLVGAAVADDTIRLPSDPSLRETAEWPWKCCDRAPCLRIFPPRCSCRDVVDKCDAACENCEEVDSGFVCLDLFPGPETGELPQPCTGA